MKHRIRKLTSLLLSLSLISALTLPAAASNALGEDLSAKDTLLHQETQLSTNVFWSTTYSDLRTENLITYTPNKAVTPIVTYGDALTDRSSVADMAALLEEDGYRVVMNCREPAGQSVFHIHMHVLGQRRMAWPPG